MPDFEHEHDQPAESNSEEAQDPKLPRPPRRGRRTAWRAAGAVAIVGVVVAGASIGGLSSGGSSGASGTSGATSPGSKGSPVNEIIGTSGNDKLVMPANVDMTTATKRPEDMRAVRVRGGGGNDVISTNPGFVEWGYPEWESSETVRARGIPVTKDMATVDVALAGPGLDIVRLDGTENSDVRAGSGDDFVAIATRSPDRSQWSVPYVMKPIEGRIDCGDGYDFISIPDDAYRAYQKVQPFEMVGCEHVLAPKPSFSGSSATPREGVTVFWSSVGANSVVRMGTPGPDTFNTVETDRLVMTGAGNDVVRAAPMMATAGIVYSTGAGDDVVVAPRLLPDTSKWTTITSTNNIFTGDGDDAVFMRGGSTSVDCGAGNDTLYVRPFLKIDPNYAVSAWKSESGNGSAAYVETSPKPIGCERIVTY